MASELASDEEVVKEKLGNWLLIHFLKHWEVVREFLDDNLNA
jgi:hypothetical protein